jgi:hypothetical protein
MSPLELQAWLLDHDLAEVAIGKKVAPALAQLIDIIKEQHRVAGELAPYLHGKKPVEIAIIDERLPALIINLGTDQLEAGMRLADAKAMSIGRPVEDAEYSEINELGEGEVSAPHEHSPHDKAK